MLHFEPLSPKHPMSEPHLLDPHLWILISLDPIPVNPHLINPYVSDLPLLHLIFLDPISTPWSL